MLFTLVRARPPVATLFPYTTLFRSAATDGAATGLPHSLQKRLLGRLGCPHAGQTASKRSPQPAQNLAPAGLSCRHWGQRMSARHAPVGLPPAPGESHGDSYEPSFTSMMSSAM